MNGQGWLIFPVIAILFVPAAFAKETDGVASWYSAEACRTNKTKNCLMANGKSLYVYEKEKKLFAASYAYPLGTRLRVTNRKNHKSVLVVTSDRGPSKRLGRLCDLGREAFRRIAPLKDGLVPVKIEVV